MELDDHLFIEKQSEEQQWCGVPYLRGRCCWKAKELRDTNCQEAKCHLVDDQVVLTAQGAGEQDLCMTFIFTL